MIEAPVRPPLLRRIVSRRERRAYQDALDAYYRARREAAWMAFWEMMHKAMKSRPHASSPESRKTT